MLLPIRSLWIPVFAGTLMLAGCFMEQSAPTPDAALGEEGEIVQERDDFDPESLPTVTVPGFSIPGKMMKVKGEDVLLFEYSGREALELEMQGVAPDGRSVNGKVLLWKGPVHFFATEKQMAVYVGSTPEVLELLQQEGGEQFAGD